jgi:phage protein U
VIGSFGPLAFYVSTAEDDGAPQGVRAFTFDNFQRSGGAQFAVHNIHGLKPKLEFTGPNSDSVSLDVAVDASLGVNPAEKIEAFRLMMNAGEAAPLIVGVVPLGMFVLENLSERWAVVDGKGALIRAELSLSFKEYGDE